MATNRLIPIFAVLALAALSPAPINDKKAAGTYSPEKSQAERAIDQQRFQKVVGETGGVALKQPTEQVPVERFDPRGKDALREVAGVLKDGRNVDGTAGPTSSAAVGTTSIVPRAVSGIGFILLFFAAGYGFLRWLGSKVPESQKEIRAKEKITW